MNKPIRESQIEKYLVAQVKALGGECRKVRWIGRTNAPDRFVMLPRIGFAAARWREQTGNTREDYSSIGAKTVPGYAVWVELKKQGGKATFPKDAHERGQLREHERMRGMGQRVEVIDSFDGVDKLMGEMK